MKNRATKPDRSTSCPDCGYPLVAHLRINRQGSLNFYECCGCENRFDSLEAIAIAWTARLMLDRGVLS